MRAMCARGSMPISGLVFATLPVREIPLSVEGLGAAFTPCVICAGEVIYNATGFNDKNRENLGDDLKELLGQSNVELVSSLAKMMNAIAATNTSSTSSGGGGRGGKAGRGGRSGGLDRRRSTMFETSASSQFRSSLRSLLEVITATTPAFIRCIKPNHDKQPNSFHASDVLRQLRYAGMMETVRIRQQGFSMRVDHASFFAKHRFLEPRAANVGELVGTLSRGTFPKRDVCNM